MPDIVLHGETGLLFRAGDERELATLLLHLLENPGEIIRMGQNAQRFVKDTLSMDKIIVRLEKIYYEIVSLKR